MFTVQGAKLLGFWQCDVLFPAPPSVPWTTSTFLKSTYLGVTPSTSVGEKFENQVIQLLLTRYFTRGRVPPPRTIVVKRTTIKVVVTSTFLTFILLGRFLIHFDLTVNPPPHQIQGEGRVHRQLRPWNRKHNLCLVWFAKQAPEAGKPHNDHHSLGDLVASAGKKYV